MSEDNRMYCYLCVTLVTNETRLFWYRKDAEKWKEEHTDPTARFKKLVIS
jgi:hypothetical protein